MKVAHNFDDCERTEDVIINENVTFEGLMLSEKCLQGLNESGFRKPSPIQLRSIPLGKCGFDLIVEAKSGTGKTAVFGIVALEMLKMDSNLQVVILAPTREIAVQIGHVITTIGLFIEGLKVEVVIGGTSYLGDIEKLQNNKYQILVGSPGRVKQLIQNNIISIDSVRLFVLDEADKLMEGSFQGDINYIFSQLPLRKQVIAASATYTTELREFLARYMRSPSHIRPNISCILLGITQYISIVPLHLNTVRQSNIISKELLRILSNVSFKQCLVFCNYQTKTRTICNILRQNGWPTEFLASSQRQDDRLKSLDKLQSFSCRVLVATDLAARGIDATNVDLIVNLEQPYDLATYLHRIGRAGRYGSKGMAITVVSAGKEEMAFKALIDELGDPLLLKPFNLESLKSANEEKSMIINNTVEAPCILNNANQKYSTLIMTLPTKVLSIETFDDLSESLKHFELINQTAALDSFDNLLDSLSAFSCEDVAVKSHQDPPEYDFSLIEYLNKSVSPEIQKSNLIEDKMEIDDLICKEEIPKSTPENHFKHAKYNQNHFDAAKINHEVSSSKRERLPKLDNTKNNLFVCEDITECKQSNVRGDIGCSQRIPRKKRIIRTTSKTKEAKTTQEPRTSAPATDYVSYENYLQWRMQLSYISQQVQQSVYLKTMHTFN